MQISTGTSRLDTNWIVKKTTWKDLCKKLAIPIRTKETMAEYLAMTKDEKSRIKDVGGFVGGEVRGRRNKENTLSRSLVTLDADFAEKDIWDRASTFLDYAMCCYSTHSHRPEQPRLRFVIPLDRDVTPEEYEPIARQIASDIGIDQFDITTYETSRLMYWPSVCADGEYIFEVSEGSFVSADKVLARYKDWKDAKSWPTGSQETNVRVKQAGSLGDPAEKPGLVGAFCSTYDIHEAINRFLPSVYELCGDRYTYTQGSTSCGAVVYDNGKFLYSHHSTDPTCGTLCNAFDLVRIHLFGAEDESVKPDTPITQYPSYISMIKLVSQDPECKKMLVQKNTDTAKAVFSKEQDEESEPDTEEWFSELSLDRKGKIEPTIDNICLILENDKNLRNCIAVNEFTNRLCVINNLPWRKCSDKRNGDSWDDMDDSNLRRYIEKVYQISCKDKVNDALNVVMLRHSYHPIRDYLNKLEWDGELRVEDLFIDYFGADDTQYTKAVTRKWFTAAVTRVMHPGCKFDNMIVLVGTQGIGKSYFGKLISRDWYSDTFNTLNGKEAYEQLKGAWIIEMGELSVLKKAEVESVKMFISKQEDNFRAAYARHVISNKRQCIFYGTTNDDSFLRDRTGNRRFWPIGCHPNKATKSVFNITSDDVDQIWAEVLHWYKNGETLFLSKSDTELAAVEQERYIAEDTRLGTIEAYLETPIPVNWYEMSKADRKNFIQGYLTYDGETMRRNSICASEVAYELFGDEVLQPWQSKEYHNLIISIPGWQKSHREEVSEYGKQYVYKREE